MKNQSFFSCVFLFMVEVPALSMNLEVDLCTVVDDVEK